MCWFINVILIRIFWMHEHRNVCNWLKCLINSWFLLSFCLSNNKYGLTFLWFALNFDLQPLTILLTKTTAAQNEVALSYHKVRGVHFLAVVFVYEVSNMKFDSKSQHMCC